MKTANIFINENIFESFLAISAKEQQQGLMGVEPPVPVMAFVYTRPQLVHFWMKDTPAPLDIVFAERGVVTQIHEGIPYSTSPIGQDMETTLVVEFPKGTVKKCNIRIGDSIGFIK